MGFVFSFIKIRDQPMGRQVCLTMLYDSPPHTLNFYEVIDADSEYSQWLSRNDQWVLQKT